MSTSLVHLCVWYCSLSSSLQCLSSRFLKHINYKKKTRETQYKIRQIFVNFSHFLQCEKHSIVFSTCAVLGGRHFYTPFKFVWLCTAVLVYLFIHLFHTCYEEFRPRSFKVRYQVTSNDLTSEKVWMLIKTTPNAQWPWNFQGLISIPVSIFVLNEMYISEFWYRWPKVRLILQP